MLTVNPTSTVGREVFLQRPHDFLAGVMGWLAGRSTRSSRRATSSAPPAAAVARKCPQFDSPAVLTDAAVAQALRTARRGLVAGLSGAACEHYKILPDDAKAVERFARAAITSSPS